MAPSLIFLVHFSISHEICNQSIVSRFLECIGLMYKGMAHFYNVCAHDRVQPPLGEQIYIISNE